MTGSAVLTRRSAIMFLHTTSMAIAARSISMSGSDQVILTWYDGDLVPSQLTAKMPDIRYRLEIHEYRKPVECTAVIGAFITSIYATQTDIDSLAQPQ